MTAVWRRLRRPFGPGRPTVPVVRLSGAITGGRGGGGGGLSLASLAGLIEKAFADKSAPAVALAINSPGGSPVQSALIAKHVRALATEKEKPVLAFVEDVAASGGYWLACAADEIFADASSIVGSIGVVSAGFGLHDAIGRLGIDRRVHTAGDRKMILDPFQPERAEDVAKLRALQDEMHETFKAYVRDRRGARLDAAGETNLFNGEFWTGATAHSLGLVDGLGDARSILRARFGPTVRLRAIAPRQGLLRRLRAGGFDGSERLVHAATTGALSAAEDRLLWQRYGL